MKLKRKNACTIEFTPGAYDLPLNDEGTPAYSVSIIDVTVIVEPDNGVLTGKVAPERVVGEYITFDAAVSVAKYVAEGDTENARRYYKAPSVTVETGGVVVGEYSKVVVADMTASIYLPLYGFTTVDVSKFEKALKEASAFYACFLDEMNDQLRCALAVDKAIEYIEER